LGAFLMQFLTSTTRTVTRSIGTQILLFNRETKRTKTTQKLCKHSWSDQGGSHTIAPPEYATASQNTVECYKLLQFIKGLHDCN